MRRAPRADGTAPRPGRWGPLAIVVGLIAIVVGGGQLFAAAVTAGTGATLQVGDLQIELRPGWDIESVTTSPSTARLHRGPVVLDVVELAPEPAGPTLVAQRYIAGRLRQTLSEITTGIPEGLRLADGAAAVRIAYVGVTTEGLAVEGVVTAAVGERSSGVFDASAPGGSLVAAAEDVRAMVDHAVVP
jgi:hypothetical protein